MRVALVQPFIKASLNGVQLAALNLLQDIFTFLVVVEPMLLQIILLLRDRQVYISHRNEVPNLPHKILCTVLPIHSLPAYLLQHLLSLLLSHHQFLHLGMLGVHTLILVKALIDFNIQCNILNILR